MDYPENRLVQRRELDPYFVGRGSQEIGGMDRAKVFFYGSDTAEGQGARVW